MGYLPLQNEASAALFQVITQRYLKSSTVLTTNLGIASWGKIFDDPMVAAAMLDRLLHRSVVNGQFQVPAGGQEKSPPFARSLLLV